MAIAGDPWELFRSVAGIWVVWSISSALTLLLTARGLGKLRGCKIRRLIRAEEGAAYTLSYVMVMPLYLLLICAVIETSLMLVAKIGTEYAAFAAARTAIVRYSAESPGEAESLTRAAAVRAFVPFASTHGNLRRERVDSDVSEAEIDAYLEASPLNVATRILGAHNLISSR